jgi:hypothetical protein
MIKLGGAAKASLTILSCSPEFLGLTVGSGTTGAFDAILDCGWFGRGIGWVRKSPNCIAASDFAARRAASLYGNADMAARDRARPMF